MRALLGAVVIAACHTPSPNPQPTPTPTPSPLPTPTPSPTQPPPPMAAPNDAGAPSKSLDGDELTAWLVKHDVKPPKDVDVWGSCEVVRDVALFCRGAPMESLATGESVFPLRVVLAKNGLALTAPIAAGPLDTLVEPGEDADEYQYVVLEATLDPAATTLTISERPGKTCDQILAQYKSADMAGHRRMVQKACAARGRYTLQNGKLVRAP
jgi:hypothetical protein